MVNTTPRPLYPRERPDTHCIGGCVGPMGRSGRVWKISLPPRFDPRTLRPLASRYTDCTISTPRVKRKRSEAAHSPSTPLPYQILTYLSFYGAPLPIYRTIILPVVLYGCETWSLTLREERRLRLFENRVLRRVFGPKRGEVTGEWRKLHNEE